MKKRLALLAFAAILGVTGCGDDDGGSVTDIDGGGGSSSSSGSGSGSASGSASTAE